MKNKLQPLHGNILLLIGSVLLIFIGSAVQHRDLMSGLLITEFILIMLPAFIFALMLKVNIKEEFRFNGFTFKEFLFVTLSMLALYPVAVFVNFLANIWLSTFGELPANPITVPEDFRGFILTLLVVAGSAGLCEEILFRGFIMRSYEKIGQWKAILLSGLFFGMFHFNLQNLLGPILLGIVIGYIVIRTNSLWMGIYAHMLNNAVAVGLARILAGIPESTEPVEPLTLEAMIFTAVFLLIIALIFGTFSYMALRGLHKTTKGKHENNSSSYEDEENGTGLEYPTYDHYQKPVPKDSFLSWIPVIIFILIFIGMSVLQIMFIKDSQFI